MDEGEHPFFRRASWLGLGPQRRRDGRIPFTEVDNSGEANPGRLRVDEGGVGPP